MFHGTVESSSHEGGLLLSFNGSSPALGSHIIDEDENWIGKVDSVIGNVDSPLVHLSPISRDFSTDLLLGRKVKVRPRQARNQYDRRGGERRGGDDRRGGERRGGDDRRGGDRRGGDRRGGSGDQEMKPGDWKCRKCSNINFARRNECNRCSASRPDGGGGRRDGDRRDGDRRGGDRRDGDRRGGDRRGGDRRGGDRRGGDRRGGDRRGGDRRGGDRRGGDRRGGDRRGGDRQGGFNSDTGGQEMKPGDWNCPKCKNLNFARRDECNRCSARRPSGGSYGGGDRRGGDRRGGDRRGGDRRGGDRRDGDRRDGDRGSGDRRSPTSGRGQVGGRDNRIRRSGGDRPARGKGAQRHFRNRPPDSPFAKKKRDD